MLTSAVRLLFGNPASAAVDQPAVAPENVPEAPERPRPSTIWPASRLALNNHLWGDGFIFPGGEAETLRLVRPLGASAAASLLLVGVWWRRPRLYGRAEPGNLGDGFGQ